MMRKMKVAQIGTSANSHGNLIWNSLKKQSDIFEIVGYAFPENEREKFPKAMMHFEGYREMTVEEILNDSEIEAVVIETEEIYLTKYAIMAAKAGKHIHMEKPGGRKLREFETLMKIMKDSEKVFHVGYMYRYNPCVIELMQQIENGDFGEIISIEAQMSCTHKKEVREWFGNFKGGNMFFLGCHLIDLIFRIQGTPKNIIPLNRSTGVDGVNAEDFGMAVLEYERGASFAKVNSTEMGGYLRRQFVVTGTKATVELKPFEIDTGCGHKTTKTYCDFTDWHQNGIQTTTEIFDRYDGMMRAFAEYVVGEKNNPYTLDYELELYKIILKCCGA
ncbi:MAG: Gfo/Idh/MocA family oxidoreductase [Tyzzerella sp.]|nr:Gfo/Idh/MocA family oxidoreductase [Tyzzerella sp.]